MSRVKIAVFASGSGSNFRAIAEKERADRLHGEIVMLVCDQPDAPVISLAEQYKVPVFMFHPRRYSDKQAYEVEIKTTLQSLGVEWIFLAGYMRIIGKTLIDAYPNRIVNIHPSLLPDFPGKDAIGQVYDANVSTTGITVHYVDTGVDTGPIIDQVPVNVEADDTKETLKQRIQQVEHEFYPNVIHQLIDGTSNNN